jgi:hypothetical protein
MKSSEKNIFKSLYFKNSSIKIKIIIWLLQLIYITNYNIKSMKIKVDRIQEYCLPQSTNCRTLSYTNICHNNRIYNYKFVDYGSTERFLRWSLSVIKFRKHRQTQNLVTNI